MPRQKNTDSFKKNAHPAYLSQTTFSSDNLNSIPEEIIENVALKKNIKLRREVEEIDVLKNKLCMNHKKKDLIKLTHIEQKYPVMLETTSYSTNVVSKVGENDVLLGSGTPTTKHKGNIAFRRVVKQHKGNYLCASNSYEKYLIVMEVNQKVKSLCPPGRFIRRNAETNAEVNDDEIKQKISQALEGKASLVRKCHKNDKMEQNNLPLINGDCAYKWIDVTSDETPVNNDSNLSKIGDKIKQNIKTSIPRKTPDLQEQTLFSQTEKCHYSQLHGTKTMLIDPTSYEMCLFNKQGHASIRFEDNKDGRCKDMVLSTVDLPLENVVDIEGLDKKPKGAMINDAKTNIELDTAFCLLFLSQKK